MLLDLFGCVSRVQAVTSNSFFEREVEDVATAIVLFEQGTCATLTVAHSANEPQDTLEVFGSAGSIHVPVLNEGKFRVVKQAERREELHPPASNLHQPLIEDFVQALRENRDPVIGGAIGRSVAAIEDEIAIQNRLPLVNTLTESRDVVLGPQASSPARRNCGGKD